MMRIRWPISWSTSMSILVSATIRRQWQRQRRRQQQQRSRHWTNSTTACRHLTSWPPPRPWRWASCPASSATTAASGGCSRARRHWPTRCASFSISVCVWESVWLWEWLYVCVSVSERVCMTARAALFLGIFAYSFLVLFVEFCLYFTVFIWKQVERRGEEESVQ